MNRNAETVMRRIRKIFAAQDDRLIVLLRSAPHALAHRDAVKRLSELQSAYEDELVIVPFVAADCRFGLDERIERQLGRRIRRTGFTLAVEYASAGVPGWLSSWSLWDGNTPLRADHEVPFAARLCPPAPPSELGWALPIAEGECLAERLAILGDASMLIGGRRLLAGLRLHGVCSPGILRHAKLTAGSIAVHRDRLGGAVLDLRENNRFGVQSEHPTGEACFDLDVAKALLDELANVVTHCRIAAYTCAGQSLWRRL